MGPEVECFYHSLHTPSPMIHTILEALPPSFDQEARRERKGYQADAGSHTWMLSASSGTKILPSKTWHETTKIAVTEMTCNNEDEVLIKSWTIVLFIVCAVLSWWALYCFVEC